MARVLKCAVSDMTHVAYAVSLKRQVIEVLNAYVRKPSKDDPVRIMSVCIKWGELHKIYIKLRGMEADELLAMVRVGY